MITAKNFYQILGDRGVSFYTGVPDSLLKDFGAFIMDNVSSKNHIITANEGNAVALAAGRHLGTGEIPLVYMQNSGTGNAVNPLLSLTSKEVYSIPMLLLIGWRGEPGVKDEPQHMTQGRLQEGLLKSMEIEYGLLPTESEDLESFIDSAVSHAKKKSEPYAILVRKGTFESYILQNKLSTDYELSREDAVKLVKELLGRDVAIVSTTGKTSRELFEYNMNISRDNNDFLTVGSMGHTSSIALGVALGTDKEVYCFDGDGSAIMHMGSLGINGKHAPKNFKHVIFNNGAHDSVGGQPTVGYDMDLASVAKASGYKIAITAGTSEEVEEGVRVLQSSGGPALLEIKVNKGAREDLGRPTKTPKENKKNFMDFVRGQ